MKKDLIVPSLITLSGTIVLSILKALWGPRMAAFVWDVFISSWTVLLPAVAGLIYWNVQFFKHYKEEKDKEFRSWLTAQEANWQRHFDALARQAKDGWELAESSLRSYCQNVESRLSRLEPAIDQRDQAK